MAKRKVTEQDLSWVCMSAEEAAAKDPVAQAVAQALRERATALRDLAIVKGTISELQAQLTSARRELANTREDRAHLEKLLSKTRSALLALGAELPK